MPDISCIIVSFNNSPYLIKAITSVLEQTLPVNEIIVADDGSTDDSRELIKSLAIQHNNIKPIFRENNLGAGQNRDLAIRSAKSEIITALDGDDWYYPNKIEKEYSALNKNNAVAFSDISLMLNDHEQLGFWDMRKFPGSETYKRLKWVALRTPPIPTHMMLSKKLYIESGGMKHNINLYEDWDFKIRLSGLPYMWVHSGVTGMAYRQTESGLSSAHYLKHLSTQIGVIKTNKNLLIKHFGKTGYLNIVSATLFRGIRRAPRRILNKILKSSN